jgi:hypothetical protein
VIADALAECQARHPSVPIIFAETRALAQEWTYRFLAAARAEVAMGSAMEAHLAELVEAGPAPEAPPTPGRPTGPSTAEVRAWALAEGLAVSDRGRLRPDVWAAWEQAHSGS